MKTLLLEPNQVDIAVQLLSADELVVIPTETVYGVGANACSDIACSKVYQVKSRPVDNPLIVHCDGLEMVSTVLSASSKQDTILELLQTLEGKPITVISEASDYVSEVARAGGTSIAVRIPHHELCKNIISLLGYPIAAPSANISGQPSATDAMMAWNSLAGKVAAIVDGGMCNYGLESTIIDATVDGEVQILRYGSVSREELIACLPQGIVLKENESLPNIPSAITPGSAYTHYAPNCRILPFSSIQEIDFEAIDSEQKKFYALCCVDTQSDGVHAHISEVQQNKVAYYRFFSSWAALAPELFRMFAEFDALGITTAYVQCPSPTDHATLYDRITRASKGT